MCWNTVSFLAPSLGPQGCFSVFPGGMGSTPGGKPDDTVWQGPPMTGSPELLLSTLPAWCPQRFVTYSSGVPGPEPVLQGSWASLSACLLSWGQGFARWPSAPVAPGELTFQPVRVFICWGGVMTSKPLPGRSRAWMPPPWAGEGFFLSSWICL